MARLNSWFSSDVTHALGWALIHSLWQCLSLAALAAVLMAFSRRPSIRYLFATGALIAMLAAPTSTFLILMEQAAPVHALPATRPAPLLWAVPGPATLSSAMTVALGRHAGSHDVAGSVLADTKKHFPGLHFPPDFLGPGLFPWLVGAWLCGVALFGLRLAGGLLLLEYKRLGPSSVPSHRILSLAYELQLELGIVRVIRYLECGWLQAPAVVGWIRPIVLLPISALTGLDEAQLKAVIAHELAHVRRLDLLVNLLQVLIEALLFYHPAVWWLNRRIRAERELCCDEIAVSLTGNRVEYAKILTLMAEWERAPALAMAANRGPLSERVFHILGKKPFGIGRRVAGLTGSIMFLVAAVGAANALFGFAYPVPPAKAKASFTPAPASNQITAMDVALPTVPSVAPSAGVADGKVPALDETEARTIRRPERQVAFSPATKLVAPLPDLSRLLQTLAPQLVALDGPPAAAGDIAPTMAAWTARAPRRTCAMPTITASVALEDVPGTNLRIVPVAINGTEKQFLLDVGTKPSEISQAAVTALGLPSANNPVGSGGALSNAIETSRVAIFEVNGGLSPEDYRPHVRAASFTVGGATGHDLAFVVAKDPEMGKSKPYDGLMTSGFFKQDDLELDFAQNKLNYLAPTNCTDPDQVAYWPHAAVAAIPVNDWNGKIQVQVSIQGHAIPAVIDTTSSYTVMRRDIAELIFGLKADTPEMMADGELRDGTGLQIYQHTFPQVSFAGGVTAFNVPALIQTNSMTRNLNRAPILGSRAQFAADPSQRIPGLTLGMDVLHQLHFYVVHGHEMLYVTSAAPPAALL